MAREIKNEVTGCSALILGDGSVSVYLSNKTKLNYLKFKVVPSGWFCGYWDAGRGTKSGFYRDTLLYLGAKYAGAKITQLDRWNVVLEPADTEGA